VQSSHPQAPLVYERGEKEVEGRGRGQASPIYVSSTGIRNCTEAYSGIIGHKHRCETPRRRNFYIGPSLVGTIRTLKRPLARKSLSRFFERATVDYTAYMSGTQRMAQERE